MRIQYPPTPPLLASNNPALIYYTRQDLLGEKVGDGKQLWDMDDARRILRQQRKNGSWKYPGKLNDARTRGGYDQLETFRQLGFLIEKYGFDKRHPAVQAAARFLFTFQTKQGDFRGIYGKQYATTYSPMISELLIKAGYGSDRRVIKSLDWLMKMRQNDGGWAIPLRTALKKMNYMEVIWKPVIEPDRTKPFSHLITGCALRPLAIHPRFKNRADVKHAGTLLMSRIFERDKYVDRAAVSFWTGFSYPYWFTDILSTLDVLSRLGFKKSEPKIKAAINWLVKQQSPDGTWRKLHLLRGSDKQQYLWLTLQIARVLKQF